MKAIAGCLVLSALALAAPSLPAGGALASADVDLATGAPLEGIAIRVDGERPASAHKLDALAAAVGSAQAPLNAAAVKEHIEELLDTEVIKLAKSDDDSFDSFLVDLLVGKEHAPPHWPHQHERLPPPPPPPPHGGAPPPPPPHGGAVPPPPQPPFEYGRFPPPPPGPSPPPFEHGRFPPGPPRGRFPGPPRGPPGPPPFGRRPRPRPRGEENGDEERHGPHHRVKCAEEGEHHGQHGRHAHRHHGKHGELSVCRAFKHFAHSTSYLARSIVATPAFFAIWTALKVALTAFALLKAVQMYRARREGRVRLEEDAAQLPTPVTQEKA